ncbi:hypothetical protein M0R72_08120 [Candidatus Pacearchaeota archaeon]|jgi:hypothetical protein|nr:hypothetical protein [Candidatus Pacearchaeota archaeon]
MSFAEAKPTANDIIPVVGKIISTGTAGRGLGCSSATIVRRIKDGSIKGFVAGETKTGKPIYATTDWYVRQYWNRLNRRHSETPKPSVAGTNPDLIESKITSPK